MVLDATGLAHLRTERRAGGWRWVVVAVCSLHYFKPCCEILILIHGFLYTIPLPPLCLAIRGVANPDAWSGSDRQPVAPVASCLLVPRLLALFASTAIVSTAALARSPSGPLPYHDGPRRPLQRILLSPGHRPPLVHASSVVLSSPPSSLVDAPSYHVPPSRPSTTKTLHTPPSLVRDRPSGLRNDPSTRPPTAPALPRRQPPRGTRSPGSSDPASSSLVVVCVVVATSSSQWFASELHPFFPTIIPSPGGRGVGDRQRVNRRETRRGTIQVDRGGPAAAVGAGEGEDRRLAL